jgi:hypothetical protein
VNFIESHLGELGHEIVKMLLDWKFILDAIGEIYSSSQIDGFG